MASTNTKRTGSYSEFPEKMAEVRLAGGYGPPGAQQENEKQLRRSVLACLLGEDVFYQDGKSVTDQIKSLVPKVLPEIVAKIAVEARTKQKLRHVPLLLARVMASLPTHRELVGDLLPQIILRADELTEYLALYKKDSFGKFKLSAQSKIGLARAFTRFNEYHLGKYKEEGKTFSIKDVLFLCHAKPKDKSQELLWKKLIGGYCENCWGSDPTIVKTSKKSRKPLPILCQCDNFKEAKLAIPDTWETELSAGKDKKATWERLIKEGKLGANAFLKNLRNMQDVIVDPEVLRYGFSTIKSDWLLPLDFLKAARYAPRYEREIEDMMLRSLSTGVKLPGYTVFIVDVSGSMGGVISGKSDFTRLQVAEAMAMLAAESCERVAIYATAGDDFSRKCATKIISNRRGFALAKELDEARNNLGGGGIFTRQVLEYVRTQEKEPVDRIIIFSDSQDCDSGTSKMLRPWAKYNYIVDVSAHSHGVNYEGLWTAEVSGWSEHFLAFIAALEGLSLQENNE
jgi:60 kDa SS-A/Ro ribonucleoprotein